MDDPGIEQDTLCRGRFSCVDVSCNTDIAYSVKRDCSCHNNLPIESAAVSLEL
ncbi:hypothetical protein CKA32_000232 [Geitlerinema sp. FC II]|nr:hypothetical protein CKA32_000232 [Geitlerinema sp. FC II]